MASERYDKAVFFVRLGAVLWLVGVGSSLLNSAIPPRLGLRELMQLLLVEVSSAIAIAAVAAFETPSFYDDFRRRMVPALHTGLLIACVWGVAGLLPVMLIHSPVGRILSSMLGASAVFVLYAPFIAGATAMPPLKAIETSVRLWLSGDGIKVFKRPMPAAVVLLPALWWINTRCPADGRETALGVVAGLLAAIICPIWAVHIWARFKGDPMES